MGKVPLTDLMADHQLDKDSNHEDQLELPQNKRPKKGHVPVKSIADYSPVYPLVISY